MNGETGNIDQAIDKAMSSPGGNGALKGWATIDSSGSVRQCWNCSSDPMDTKLISTGVYQVKFNLGSIFRRPALATIACHFSSFCPNDATEQAPAFIQVVPTNSYKVLIHDVDGNPTNRNFTLVVF